MDTSLRVVVCHGNQLLADCISLAIGRSRAVCFSEVFHPDDAVEDIGILDVLMLDASLPDATVVGMIACAKRVNPRARVLLLVPRHAADRMMEFTRFKADGCLLDQSGFDELEEAVYTVAAGETYCSVQAANAIFRLAGQSDKDREWSAHPDQIRLTEREREILELIAWEKMGNKQIAYRLNISLYTVKNHVHNIIEKLGVDDRHTAVQKAHRLMLIGHQ
ncbi:MAG: response regulator transcription factor [Planctomycetaceae bacterium]